MPRGRPVQSIIRQRIVELLNVMEVGYGYEISKFYNDLYPEVTQRSIYYHLRKGVQTGELNINEIRQEKGEYSWGNTVEKIYYTLGRNAQPKGDVKISKYLKRIEWKKPVSARKFTRFVDRFRKEK